MIIIMQFSPLFCYFTSLRSIYDSVSRSLWTELIMK